MDKTILDYTEATDLADDDWIILDSESGGGCRIRAKQIEPRIYGIEVTYTQTQTVTVDTPLNDLRQDLVVKAVYRNNRKKVVTDYTLSGTLAVGTSNITVSYHGYDEIIQVTVSSNYIYEWDFTQSLNDLVQNEPATLYGSGIYRDSSGVTISDNASYIRLSSSSIFQAGKTYEIDFGSMTPNFTSNAYLFGVSSQNGKGFLYHRTMGWAANKGGINYYTTGTTCYDKEIFENKTLKAICTSNKFYVYAVDKALGTELEIFNAENCVDSTAQVLNIGMGYYNMTVKAARVYDNL